MGHVVIVHVDTSSLSHALRIFKYSEKSGRNLLAQLLANRQKKKKAYGTLSIYPSMMVKITSVRYAVSLEKLHIATVIPR